MKQETIFYHGSVTGNLDTILAVLPDREFITMALAFTSTAMAQVAWEIASRLL